MENCNQDNVHDLDAFDADPFEESIPTTSYTVQYCTGMAKRTDLFRQNLCSNSKGIHWVVDNLSGNCFLLPNTITFSVLQYYFKETGHALALDLTRCVSVPFAIDLDCVGCKQKSRHDSIVFSALRSAIDSFCMKLHEKKLPTSYIAMQRKNHCGIHIYFSFNVSLVLYYQLLELFDSALAAMKTSLRQIVVDRVSSIPLPFSAKEDGLLYEPIKGYETQIDHFPPFANSKWFDVKNYHLKGNEHAVNVDLDVVGTFESIHDATLDSWSAAINKRFVLLASRDAILVAEDRLLGYKTPWFRFTSHLHPVLESHLNASDDGALDFKPVPLHERIRELSSIVATNHYGTNDKFPGYSLHKLLLEKDCRYAFYILTAIFFHLKNLDLPVGKTIDELFNLCANNATLLHLASSIKQNLGKISELNELFNDPANKKNIGYPVVWIKCVSDQIKIPTMIYHDLDMAVHMLRTKYPLMYFSGPNDAQFYENGSYHTTSFAKSTSFHQEAVEIKEQLQLKHSINDTKSYIYSKWLSHDSTFINNTDVNIYRYFINTSSGVWNTITHSLMEHIPMLYFSTEATMYPMNFENLNMSRYLSNQYRLWVTNVVMKGLYAGPQHFSNHNLSAIWKACKPKIKPKLCEDLFQLMERDFELDPILVASNAMKLSQYGNCNFEDLCEMKQEDGNDAGLYTLAVFFSVLQKIKKINEERKSIDLPPFVYEEPQSFIEKTISSMFDYDAVAIDEFLSDMAFMFVPWKPRSKMISFIGAAGAGKSTLTKFLNRIWAKSIYVTSRSFASSEPGKPSPEMISINNNYMVILNEINKIDATLLKTLTGDDASHHRNLYQNTVSKQRSCATIVAVSNQYPIMSSLDEAVYVRLAPFKFLCKFLPTSECEKQDHSTNPLVLYPNHTICSDAQADTVEHAQQFLDLVYAAFVRKRNPLDTMNLPVQNEVSVDCLESIMCSNSYDLNSKIYAAMRDAQIVRGKHLSITLTDLISKIVEKIPDIKESQLKILFAGKISNDTLMGFGPKAAIVQVTDCKYFIKQSRAVVENKHPTFAKQMESTLWIHNGYYITFPPCFEKPIP